MTTADNPMSTSEGQSGELPYQPCRIEDGRFVAPCHSLTRAFDGHSFGKGRGLFLMTLTNLTTRKPSRSFVVLRMGEFVKKGIVINCCPFCGERIDAPIVSAEDDPPSPSTSSDEGGR